MAEKKTGVLALALAQVKKSDGDKAQDRVKKQVRDNENDWRNASHVLLVAAESAEEALEALNSDPTASADQLITASRAAMLARQDYDTIQELAKARF
jgi:hypothetical protein